MNYAEAIDFLQDFPDVERGTKRAKVPTMPLESMKRLLAELGHPQKTARTIHITGSKGKGSTATCLAALLKSAGYRTALYTSPHLHSYCERIAFDLQPVSQNEFAHGLEEIQEVIKKLSSRGEGPFSTFGLITALFFHMVQQQSKKVDWQIVEVGLGGTYDATNVFDEKQLAIVTAISREHTAVLGKSIVEIARNKVGIVTSDCTAILAPQRDDSVRQILTEICNNRKARLVDVNQVAQFELLNHTLDGQTFSLNNQADRGIFSMRLLGNHQIENALTAITAIEALQEHGVRFDSKSLREGLENAFIPGRFEVLPLNIGANASSRPLVILDGAHNQDSARALADTIQSVFPGKHCIFLIGVNQDKEVEAIWQELKQVSKCLIATGSNNPRAMAPDEIISRLVSRDALNGSQHQYESSITSYISKDVNEAMTIAGTLANLSDVICITGSLYLVAEAREQLLNRVDSNLAPIRP